MPPNRFKTDPRYKKGGSLVLPAANPEQGVDNLEKIANASYSSQKGELKRQVDQEVIKAIPVEFPPHLFIPAGSESIDHRQLISLAFGTTDHVLWSWTAPEGAIAHFISYAIFNDGLVAASYEFKPQKNGNRVFRYHGDPDNNHKIDLGLAPDLSNSSLIPCQLTLEPGDTIQWLLSNNALVDTSMGVRMVGYLDWRTKRVAPQAG